MILYHAVSTYQLLEFILHKNTEESNSEAAIIIASDIVRRYPNYDEILNKYFTEIFVYNNGISVSLFEDDRKFNDYFKSVFKGFTIEMFEKIYVACAHSGFGIYISRHNCQYIFVEDAAGALSHIEGVKEHVKKTNIKRDEELERYKLYDGSSHLTNKRIYNMEANPEIEKFDTDQNFNVADELKCLEELKRKEIIGLFVNFNELSVPKNSVVILTEHLYNLEVMTWEEQGLMYQLVVDYFLSNYHLVFKTHPDDLFYYKKFFQHSSIIREIFPAELLPYLFTNTPDCIATVSSTSIFGLGGIIKDKLCFNQKFSYFDKEFKDLHKYFVALKYGEDYFKKGYKLVTVGVNNIIIENFIKYSDIAYDDEYIEFCNLSELYNNLNGKKYVILVDKTKEAASEWCEVLQEKADKEIFIFLNSDKKYCFYDYSKKNLWKYIYPIVIKKYKLRTENVLDLKNDKMYIFSKKEFEMKIIEKELENTGIKILSEEFTDDKLRILVLEGLLKATEKRLEYYMEKCKEYDL